MRLWREKKLQIENVVHCKDCRYWQDAEYGVVEMPFCRLHGLDSEIGEADDFCSRGEVK